MKDQEHYRILDSVVRLEVTRGHLRWKIAEVSRLSGVQRTLIYYYFGKSKASILTTAMNIIGDEFFGLSEERLRMWKEGRVAASIRQTRELFTRAPHVAEFYFHWRHQKSEVQTHLKHIEKRYRAKLAEFFPQTTPAQREALWCLFFGLALVPELGEAALLAALKALPFEGLKEN